MFNAQFAVVYPYTQDRLFPPHIDSSIRVATL